MGMGMGVGVRRSQVNLYLGSFRACNVPVYPPFLQVCISNFFERPRHDH